MPGISSYARQISFCPTTTETIEDNSEFIVLVPNEGTFTIVNEPDENAAESRKEFGTAGPASISGYKTSGNLGEFKFQPQLDGSTANDYLFRSALSCGDWETLTSAGGGNHKITLDGATYNDTTGVLDITSITGDPPDNLADGWAVRIRKISTNEFWTAEATITSPTEITLEPAPDNTLTGTLTADYEMAAERIREKMEMQLFHVKDYQTDNGVARYYPGCVVNSMNFDFSVKSDVKVTYGVTGGQSMILKKGNTTFPGETLVTPEQHPTVTTAVDTGQITVNGVNQSARCGVNSLAIETTRDIKENERVYILGGVCGVSLKNFDNSSQAKIVFEDETYLEAAVNNTKLGLFVTIPPSDGYSYSLSLPSNTISAVPSEDDGEMFVDVTFSAERNDDLGYQFAIHRFRI